MSSVRAPVRPVRPKAQGGVQVWTLEGFKDVGPAKYQQRRGAGAARDAHTTSFDPLLNRYLDPREEAAAVRREETRQAKRRAKAAAHGVALSSVGRLDPIVQAPIQDPYDPRSLALERRAPPLLPPLPPPPGSLSKRRRERVRYNPIRHAYAEPDVDAHVRAAERDRRDAVSARKRAASRQPINPLTMARLDGSPLPLPPTPGRRRLVTPPDTSRVLNPPPLTGTPSASGQARKLVDGYSSTSSRAGYDILRYSERPPRDPAAFSANRNGLSSVNRAYSGKSNRSGVGFDILTYGAPDNPPSDAAGNGSVRKNRAAGGRANLSGSNYNILNGTPISATRSVSRAAAHPPSSLPRRLAYPSTPRSASAPPGPDPRGKLDWNSPRW